MNQGKTVIVVMVLVGASLATFAWWHRWTRSQAVLDTWGSEAVIAIRLGPQAELWQLMAPQTAAESASNGHEIVQIGDQTRAIQRRIDIANVPGLIHARHMLVQSEGYVFGQEPPSDCVQTWDFVLQFADDEHQATLALDLDCERIRLLERDREAGMSKVAPGFRSFLNETIQEIDAATNASDEPTEVVAREN